MAYGGQHVLGYSPDGKLFAVIDDQGILRIWDTDTNDLKQEYTPNLHLAGPCSALVWITVSSNARTKDKKGKKSRKSFETKESLYVALGTSKGQVSLYSYAEGKIERNLKGEGHNGRITSIIRDSKGQLYTCGEDCQVIVWSLAEEKQLSGWNVGPEKPQCISFSPLSNNLVVASRFLKVYSVETQELVQTFTGHTSEINYMEYVVANGGTTEYVLTTSRMERIICLWKIGKKGRNKASTCTLLMEDIAHCLASQVYEDNSLRVASVTRSGVIHVYVLDFDSIKSDKPLKPKVTIRIASDSATVIEPIMAVATSLQHAAKPGQLLFAYGDNNCLIFEQLKPNFSEKMQVLVRTDPRKLIKQKLMGKREGNLEAALKILTPVINAKDVDYKSSITVSKKKLNSMDLPMEARLQNLHLNTADGGKVKPQSQSKVQLLVQSLHSKDEALLRSVLCTKDSKTIYLTLSKLPVQYVGTLVNELTLLMQQRHANVEFAMNWLKILAQTHSSQLMALGADDLLTKFGPCIGIIEHRANCLRELSKLNGRLQLLVSQIKRNSDQDQDNLKTENALVLEDNDDSSNSDLDINKSSSDDEWEEDEDESRHNGAENMEKEDDDDDDDDDDEDDNDMEL